jgi:hypothetical protein
MWKNIEIAIKQDAYVFFETNPHDIEVIVIPRTLQIDLN